MDVHVHTYEGNERVCTCVCETKERRNRFYKYKCICKLRQYQPLTVLEQLWHVALNSAVSIRTRPTQTTIFTKHRVSDASRIDSRHSAVHKHHNIHSD